MYKMRKCDFLNKLDVNGICEDVIISLQNSKEPLILWGCGDVADAVYKYLQLNNIIISQVWVDRNIEDDEFHGFVPKSIQEIIEKYGEFNVILGHSHYDMGEKIKKQYTQIKNVYYVFSVHYEQYNKVSYSAIEKESDEFIQLYNNLADSQSGENLIAYLNTKLTGNVKYIIEAYSKEMSFFNNDIFSMSEYETYLDIGAYNGDTVKGFLDETNGRYRKIIMIEPDVKNFIELNKYLASKHLKDVVPSMIGAWNCIEELVFKTGNEQISSLDIKGDILKDSERLTIFAAPIDEIFDNEKISFIKINYFEGVLEALQGCKLIICKNHPKLAVCVGFDIYNVIKISRFILSLNVGYKIYLRFNRAMSSTFTLYAVVD